MLKCNDTYKFRLHHPEMKQVVVNNSSWRKMRVNLSCRANALADSYICYLRSSDHFVQEETNKWLEEVWQKVVQCLYVGSLASMIPEINKRCWKAIPLTDLWPRFHLRALSWSHPWGKGMKLISNNNKNVNGKISNKTPPSQIACINAKGMSAIMLHIYVMWPWCQPNNEKDAWLILVAAILVDPKTILDKGHDQCAFMGGETILHIYIHIYPVESHHDTLHKIQ